jgi:hypothetical protein
MGLFFDTRHEGLFFAAESRIYDYAKDEFRTDTPEAKANETSLEEHSKKVDMRERDENSRLSHKNDTKYLRDIYREKKVTLDESVDFKRSDGGVTRLRIGFWGDHSVSEYNRCIRIKRGAGKERIIYRVSDDDFKGILVGMQKRIINRMVGVRPLLMEDITRREAKEGKKLKKNRTPKNRRDFYIERYDDKKIEDNSAPEPLRESLIWNNENFWNTKPEYILFYLLHSQNSVTHFKLNRDIVGRGIWMLGDYNYPHLKILIREDDREVFVNVGSYYEYKVDEPSKKEREVTMELNTIMLREFGDKDHRMDHADDRYKEGDSAKIFEASRGWVL